MIIFFGGFEILVILTLFLACISGAAELIGNLLHVFFIMFLIKNVIQDVVFALIKNHKGVIMSLVFLLFDITRMILFFYTANLCVNKYSHASGLSYIDGTFGFIFYIIVGGAIFLFGEISSLFHGFEKDDFLGNGKLIIINLLVIFLLISLGKFLYW